jgi:penicillin-binding protein 2
MELQKAAVEAFGDRSGAAVALNVHSGEVLAMVSLPTYNPAQFARGISPDEWRNLLGDRRNPLQNKAITGLYPPASTFKMIVALAAMREGIATTDRVIQCDGDLVVGDSRFRCWKRQGHGATNLKAALRESCDVWFYQVGLELGIDKLAAAAKEFGLGSNLGFALPGERAGTMPTRQWKRLQMNEPWYAGETVIASIGQGYVLTTPLQLAVMTAAMVNGGRVLKPQIVERIEDWQGNSTKVFAPHLIRQLNYTPQQLQVVGQGMFAVVNELRGTGRLAQTDEVTVAGKTGTSQVVRRLSDEEEELLTGDEYIPYRQRSHALFVAYAPAENPEIAVAVVVEHGQSGGRVAAPIARDIISRYFRTSDE